MLDSENQTLKDILLNANACSAQNMKEAEEEFERTGKPLQQILIDFQILTENEILNYIAESLGTTVVDLSVLEVPKEVIDLIDADNVRMLGVVPIDADESTVTLAVRNPLNYQIADEMRFVLGKDVMIVLAEEKQIDSFIDKYYPIDINGVNDLLSEMDAMEGSDYAYANAEEDANKAPIIKFVDAVLYQAIRDKASDIHFEPFEHEFKIRYRIDGALYEMSPPPRSLAIPVISRVKILSGLNISERRKPQDGRIQLKIAGRPIDLRVSTLPTSHGESVVLRVLDRSVVNLDLDVLGINEDTLKRIREIIAMPNGNHRHAERHLHHHGADRFRQNDHAVLRPEGDQQGRGQDPDRRRPRRIRPRRHRAAPDQRRDRNDVRTCAPRLPPSGPRHHHAR